MIAFVCNQSLMELVTLGKATCGKSMRSGSLGLPSVETSLRRTLDVVVVVVGFDCISKLATDDNDDLVAAPKTGVILRHMGDRKSQGQSANYQGSLANYALN